ncbi:MAG: dTDP-4-dehydrorhamnose 3,5-epimerase [Lachnospiraceae bacterium]|nr:dTDP-4-dehydrorhamnose 3,5-epimerase [Lachnospiraceae bacterium]
MGNFIFKELELRGAYLISYFSSVDHRGMFSKCFERDIYREAGLDFQLNETFISCSAKNVIRGMHFQTSNPQAKLVSVPKGRIYDVLIDLRMESPTYKQWEGYELSAENHRALYVPRGFAHGFLSLEDATLTMYQCDGAYDRESDTGIRYDDPDIAIEWPVDNISDTIHSARDLKLLSLTEYEKIIHAGGVKCRINAYGCSYLWNGGAAA